MGIIVVLFAWRLMILLCLERSIDLLSSMDFDE